MLLFPAGIPLELIKPEALGAKVFEPLLLLGKQRWGFLDIRLRVKGGGHVSQVYGETGGLCWGRRGGRGMVVVVVGKGVGQRCGGEEAAAAEVTGHVLCGGEREARQCGDAAACQCSSCGCCGVADTAVLVMDESSRQQLRLSAGLME